MCWKFKNDSLVEVLINKICAAEVKVLTLVPLFLQSVMFLRGLIQ